MPEADAPLSPSEKLKALRRIEAALYRSKLPTLRACGLSEEIAVKVANGELIEVYLTGDDDSAVLDRYRVNEISEAGLGILAQGDVAELPPLKVSIQKHQESAWSKLFQATRSGLWDIIKIALGALGGGIVTWYLTHHPK